MSTHIIPFDNETDAAGYVTIGYRRGYGVFASTVVFDDDANIVATTTPEHRYIGYCDAEVIGLELTRAGIDAGTVDAALTTAGLVCTCDD